ncbi:MAG: CDP-diacylglycerol--glycerol-3-phosphate 3-phosphatidyltransferase [Nitrospirae bacterium]|nr:CDP-diacylglycerol--glycerol-3-phosphate 3-phosphatidyltransferase [Nitrospirota bacterium]MBI5694762.1 CDP-diacylglycerol--glycerol-3-phosphate 3-phosphatidyltransferase [Nitrospirota bacterium]
MNLPNSLTLLRVLLIPVFIYFLSSSTMFNLTLGDRALIAAGIFFIASLTDGLDGYIARKTGQITKLGKLFDPIADKLLTSAALILLVALDNQVPAWIAIVIIGREFAVTGLRAAASSEGYVIPAYEGGKAKMVFQIIAIIALLIDLGVKNVDLFGILDLEAWLIGTVAIWIAMLLALISGIQYFVQFWDKIGLREGM